MGEESDALELQQDVIETREVAVAGAGPPMSGTDRLIMMALQGNVDTDKLEKLIELKNREQDREAAREYDKKFANMQKAMPVIRKGKQVKDDKGQLMYAYAPLEDIQRECDPVIAKYGFSYRWREATIDTGKRITMRISGHGHFEETTFDVPTISQNKWSNAVQAMGSMTTYGHRYTFVAGFGITVEGEDDDASYTFDEGVRYADYIISMDTETDLKALYGKVKEYVETLRESGDNLGADFIKKYYTKRKEELS
jgi:hypothetical protein